MQDVSSRNAEYRALKDDVAAKQKILDMFDECLNNSQKNNVTKNSAAIKHSKKLGKFANINISSNDELDYFGIPNTANKLNDYVNIQKSVVDKLKTEDYFDGHNNVIVNADTEIVVEITAKGIRETLSSGKRYYTLPRKFKIAKIASIRSLPELIKYAEIVKTETDNKNRKGVSFVVLEHPLTIDDEDYNVEMKIRKTPQGNKFYIHQLQLKKTYSAVETDTNNSCSRSLNSLNMSKNNVSQNETIVNTNPTDNVDIRYSRKESIDVDDFSEEDYNYPKLGGAEYDHLKSEILTNFPRIKNKVNSINLISYNSTYYYILDDDYNVMALHKERIIDGRKRGKYKDVDRNRKGFSKRFENAGSGLGDGRSNNAITKDARAAAKNDRVVCTQKKKERKGNEI